MPEYWDYAEIGLDSITEGILKLFALPLYLIGKTKEWLKNWLYL
jgi:hypothetical protein